MNRLISRASRIYRGGKFQSSRLSGYLSSSNAINKTLLPKTSPGITKAPTASSNQGFSVSHKAYHVGNDKYIFQLTMTSDIKDTRPSLFSCAIDVSGSMECACTYDDSDVECSKFSRLDLVKHSLNTIIYCLRPQDRIALYSFTTNGKKRLSLLEMDKSGKLEALEKVNELFPEMSTNLWEGLDMSMSELDKSGKLQGYNKFDLLLTDGEPNVNPPRGIWEEYCHRLRQKPIDYGVHCFGYGYGLDSTLLTQLATGGGGNFAHVPDHTMLNTVFINFLSNCLSTVINKIRLQLNQKYSCNNVNILGHQVSESIVDIGAMVSGQPRTVLVAADVSDLDTFSINLDIEYEGKVMNYKINKQNTHFVESQSNKGPAVSSPLEYALEAYSSEPVVYELLKDAMIEIIESGLSNGKISLSHNRLDKLCELIETAKSTASDPLQRNKLQALLMNIRSGNPIQGQVMKAFSKDEWYSRWGHHYLKYFVRSHQLEVCSNFKDPSLQNYGGQMFRDIKAEVEEIFIDIPVPKPSRSKENFSGNFTQSFYSQSGPCFDGFGFVKLQNGSKKMVKDLLKGDVIINSDGNTATILCILKTLVKGGEASMVEFNGVKITPWHPVRINGKWCFPADIKTGVATEIDWFYDLVLDDHHIITINDVDTIGLGHGLTHDPVLRHPFFGTHKVIDALMEMKGWNEGVITITDYQPLLVDIENSKDIESHHMLMNNNSERSRKMVSQF